MFLPRLKPHTRAEIASTKSLAAGTGTNRKGALATISITVTTFRANKKAPGTPVLSAQHRQLSTCQSQLSFQQHQQWPCQAATEETIEHMQWDVSMCVYILSCMCCVRVLHNVIHSPCRHLASSAAAYLFLLFHKVRSHLVKASLELSSISSGLIIPSFHLHRIYCRLIQASLELCSISCCLVQLQKQA